MPFKLNSDPKAPSHDLRVTVELQFNHSIVEPELVEERLTYAWNSSQRETAGINLFMLQVARANTWELNSLKVTKIEKEPK